MFEHEGSIGVHPARPKTSTSKPVGLGRDNDKDEDQERGWDSRNPCLDLNCKMYPFWALLTLNLNAKGCANPGVHSSHQSISKPQL